MPVIRAPLSAQYWINHPLHPHLSGHSARSLCHFKRYAQAHYQLWHVDAAFPYHGVLKPAKSVLSLRTSFIYCSFASVSLYFALMTLTSRVIEQIRCRGGYELS
jgi:hypothetical protein